VLEDLDRDLEVPETKEYKFLNLKPSILHHQYIKSVKMASCKYPLKQAIVEGNLVGVATSSHKPVNTFSHPSQNLYAAKKCSVSVEFLTLLILLRAIFKCVSVDEKELHKKGRIQSLLPNFLL